MPLFKTSFTNFELYQESANQWELDFRPLSKGNFFAQLSMYFSNHIQISRTSMQSTVEQFGLTPKNFRSIAIPVSKDVHFNWFHKEVRGNQIIIFPKDRTIEAVSYANFDVFVISINEVLLQSNLAQLNFKNCIQLFKGDEEIVQTSSTAIQQLRFLINSIFVVHHTEELYKTKENTIVYALLKTMEQSRVSSKNRMMKRSDKALHNVVDYIQSNIRHTPAISELCRIANISERSLEYAFKRKYQLTPLQYIKANKMHCIKKDLLSAENRGINISLIASGYNFWHMGQFAADFKKQYNCLPSDLLRELKKKN